MQQKTTFAASLVSIYGAATLLAAVRQVKDRRTRRQVKPDHGQSLILPQDLRLIL